MCGCFASFLKTNPFFHHLWHVSSTLEGFDGAWLDSVELREILGLPAAVWSGSGAGTGADGV